MEAPHAELVELVEHEHRVAGARLADRLDHVAGQRPQIGAPVPADLGLVVHAPEGHPHELAPRGPGDALPERGLADAGWADQAQDGAAGTGIELAHREELEDAPLDLLEPVVVLVQDPAGLGDVDGRLRRLCPGQRRQPVQIAPHHGVLAGGLRHALQARQLAPGLLFHLRRHLRPGDRARDLLELGRLRLDVAQLALDRLQLLAQQEFPLALVHRLLGLAVDLVRQAEHGQPVGEEVRHPGDTLLHVEGLQQPLLLLRLDVEEVGHEVGECPRRGDGLDGAGELGGDLGQQLHRLERLAPEVVHARLEVGRERVRVLDPFHPRHEERVAVQELEHAEAVVTVHDQVMRAVGGGDVPEHGRHGADGGEVRRRELVQCGVQLLKHRDGPLGLDRLLGRSDRALAPHGEGDHHTGEQHRAAHGQHDHGVVGDLGDGGRRGAAFLLFFAHGVLRAPGQGSGPGSRRPFRGGPRESARQVVPGGARSGPGGSRDGGPGPRGPRRAGAAPRRR